MHGGTAGACLCVRHLIYPYFYKIIDLKFQGATVGITLFTVESRYCMVQSTLICFPGLRMAARQTDPQPIILKQCVDSAH